MYNMEEDLEMVDAAKNHNGLMVFGQGEDNDKQVEKGVALSTGLLSKTIRAQLIAD